jgi:hypothetical protein
MTHNESDPRELSDDEIDDFLDNQYVCRECGGDAWEDGKELPDGGYLCSECIPRPPLMGELRYGFDPNAEYEEFDKYD